MICIKLKSTDPSFNLATDEYLLRNRKEDFLVVGINSPSVIIGKHQVAHRESDTEFISRHNIPVLRRITGGGTVYHDYGNINFSFILNSHSGRQVDFARYTAPVIAFLESLGVRSTLGAKHELTVNDLKISGNAEHVFRERVLHHGTLLYDSDLDMLRASIRSDLSNYQTRSVNSNPSHVANIREIAGMSYSAEEFSYLLFRSFAEAQGNQAGEIEPGDAGTIEEIAAKRYRQWDWNYAYGPEYKYVSRFVINGVQTGCTLEVSNGIIKSCNMTGQDELLRLSEIFTGIRHMPGDLYEVASKSGIKISEPEIFNFF